jgi:hypothetical protein
LVFEFFCFQEFPPLLLVADLLFLYWLLQIIDLGKKIKSNYGHWRTIPHLIFLLICISCVWLCCDCVGLRIGWLCLDEDKQEK